jgi:hypothetical protein
MAESKSNLTPASYNTVPAGGRAKGPGSVEQMKVLGQNKKDPGTGNSASANPQGQRVT